MTPDDKTEQDAAEALRAHLASEPVSTNADVADAAVATALQDAGDAAVMDAAWSRIAAVPMRRPQPWRVPIALAAAAVLAVGGVLWLGPTAATDVPITATATELQAASAALAQPDIGPNARLAALQAAAAPSRERISRRLNDG